MTSWPLVLNSKYNLIYLRTLKNLINFFLSREFHSISFQLIQILYNSIYYVKLYTVFNSTFILKTYWNNQIFNKTIFCYYIIIYIIHIHINKYLKLHHSRNKDAIFSVLFITKAITFIFFRSPIVEELDGNIDANS